MEISYRNNTAKLEQILSHFKDCDPVFYQTLSARVNIKTYAEKIIDKSHSHEAWSGDRLVGVVAVYYNGAASEFDYITDVSVAKDYAGQGIASHLLELCFAKSQAGGGQQIRLEVEVNNQAALNLYKKFGFTEIDSDQRMITLAASSHR